MRRHLPVLIFLTALGIVAAVLARSSITDDAHITMRIVRHALEGQGLRYNAGDMGVQPATSPLNMILLLVVSWVLSLVGVPVESAVVLSTTAIGCIALPALGFAGYLLMSGDKGQSILAGASTAFLMCTPLLLGTLGLETMLSMALCLAAILAYRYKALGAMGWLLGLAFLARHDAAILAGILYFLVWRESRAGSEISAASGLVGFLVVIAPWLLFSLVYYGVTAPTTLQSKAAQGGTAYWPAWYPTLFWPWMKTYFLGSGLFAAVAITAGSLGVVRAIWKRTRAAQAILLFLAYQVLVFATYSVLRMPDYHWYFVPYGIALVIAIGWLLASFEETRLSPNAFAAISVIIIAIVGGVVLSQRTVSTGPWQSYREVGRYLESHQPETAAGLMEIGIIGYYAPSVRVFDFAGIATLEQARRVAESRASDWLDDPGVADVVVTRGVRHPLEPDFDERFESLYELEWTSSATEAFPKGLQVWRLGERPIH